MKNNPLMLILPHVSIKEGWKQLNENSQKILFVVDEEGVLRGSVTDGDVRRWILADHSIQEPIFKLMNPHPTVAFETSSEDEIKRLIVSKRLECIPIVDQKGCPQDFIFWENIVEKKTKAIQHKKINIPVIIMAGGRGVRLDPLTKVLPKPLIPLGEKPILEHIIEKFRSYGVVDFFITLNHLSNMIKAYFEDIPRDFKINFVKEDFPAGTAGALHLFRDKIDGTFVVSNCDVLIDADYADILRFHKENENKITIVSSMRHFPIPYGVIEIENGGQLKEIREKPEFDFLVNTGFYILEPELLAMIPKDRIYHMTHLIEHLRRENKKIGVYPISPTSWMDIGEFKEYKETLVKFEGLT